MDTSSTSLTKNVNDAPNICDKCGAPVDATKTIADLLEAAKDSLDWYETSPISEIETVEAAIQRTFPYKELAAVIAKAEGR